MAKNRLVRHFLLKCFMNILVKRPSLINYYLNLASFKTGRRPTCKLANPWSSLVGGGYEGLYRHIIDDFPSRTVSIIFKSLNTAAYCLGIYLRAFIFFFQRAPWVDCLPFYNGRKRRSNTARGGKSYQGNCGRCSPFILRSFL